MKFLKNEMNVDFLGVRKFAFALSLLIVLGSIGTLAVRGLNFGIDFTGGVLMEVGYAAPAELDPIRTTLAQTGYPDATVQHFGVTRDVLIRLQPKADESSADISTEVLRALRQQNANVEMRRVEYVGPQVGEMLKEQGTDAAFIALFLITLYVSLRFQWKLALGAVAALVHDVLITLGWFSLFGIPFDLTVLAAVLAVIGYSLNDTIVVFDRIRENFRVMRKGSVVVVTNAAINQTMSRTIMTGLTTLLVLLALFWWGGETIHSFALALIIGIVVGTYSSIYIASALALLMRLTKQDLLPLKEKEPVDEMP